MPLVFHGVGLTIEMLAIDGRELSETEYDYRDGLLTIHSVPERFEFSSRVCIQPEANTSLEGLYRSRTMYCTQCEAEGFRKITFYPDRPDVLSVFTVSVEAGLDLCPVLLSNGNLQSSEVLENGRHRAIWHDPHPKPSYLFALVAGDLACVRDSFTTQSGKSVALHMYVEEKDLGYCDYAIDALKRSMQWDENVYGLEYDLDLFNIVAVDDFNMGAMENKSLNIFNTSCVLAHPDICTDQSYLRVEAIVAHEYFHNYSGNRVTCRDWFQLSLKEGFTVFRDSEFSSDTHSRALKRIEDASFLRNHQFAEDAGPMSHPVRPDSFIEISNFYTLTVYEKGAEVVRMLHTLLGAETFQRGAAHYFRTFDGQAVTCDDFIDAMEAMSGRDLSQFRRWYEQAGTPTVQLSGEYQSEQKRFLLTAKQSNGLDAQHSPKPPLHIPLAVGLICGDQPQRVNGTGTTELLELTEQEQTFVFDNIESQPVVSPLRNFSAPVRLIENADEDTLRTRAQCDDDPYVRWDSLQTLLSLGIERQMTGSDEGLEMLVQVVAAQLQHDNDSAMVAHTLRLPSEEALADRASERGLVDVFQIHHARRNVARYLGRVLQEEWLRSFERHRVIDAYKPNGEQIARRAMTHLALSLLVAGDADYLSLAEQLYRDADNLSDRLAGARLIVDWGTPSQRDGLLEHFLMTWRHEALVVNQWFTLQATRPASETVEDVRALAQHAEFDRRNPNKLRALYGAFAGANPLAFHRVDGAGYALLGELVEQQQQNNPQMAARLLAPLTRWRRYQHGQDAMKAALARLASLDLSPDVFEVVERSLAN
jgi:aminopeptidase N